MRIQPLLLALPLVFASAACTAGSAAPSSITDPEHAAPEDTGKTPTSDTSDGGSGAPLTNCFGKPRNAEGRCEAELIVEDMLPEAGFVRSHAASHGTVLVAFSQGVARVAPGAKPELIPGSVSGVVSSVAAAGEYLAWMAFDEPVRAARDGDATSARTLDAIKDGELIGGHGTHVIARAGYWLWDIDITGKRPAAQLTTTSVPNIAVDDTDLYFFSMSGDDGTAVSRLPLAGGPKQLVASLAGKEEGNAAYLASTSSNVFFRTRTGIRSVSKTVREAPKLVAGGYILSITADVDGTGAFWATNVGTIGHIYRCDADGSNPHLIAELPFGLNTQLTTDETALYILDGNARALYRLPKR